MDSRELADKLRELQAMIGESKDPVVPSRVLWKAWSDGMRGIKSEATATSIDSSWKHLGPFIGELSLDQITNQLWVNEIIPGLRAKTHPGIKMFNDRKWLSMFLKWCDENNHGPRNWRRPKLTDPDPETDPGKAYTEDETKRLYANADWLLYPKLVMALEHFMRRSEIALLSKDRVDREKRIIYLRAKDTKIRKARSFPYNERLENAFCLLDQQYQDRGIESPWIFPSPLNPSKPIARGGFSKSWETCKKNANVKGRFHWLRHTAITRAFKAPGANHALICNFAGLDLAMAVKIYAHFEVDDLRGVIK